jgi:hypothetical protein
VDGPTPGSWKTKAIKKALVTSTANVSSNSYLDREKEIITLDSVTTCINILVRKGAELSTTSN